MFDAVMQVLQRLWAQMNGLNMEVQESHFSCGHLAQDLWELENFPDGKGHFLSFFEATFLMAIWDLSICHPVPHYLKLEEYSSLKTKIH